MTRAGVKGVLLPMLLWFFVSPSLVQAQGEKKTILSADRLKTQYDSIVLSENWKYRAGDDSAWADPAFDDSDWETDVDTWMFPDNMPKGGWTGLGWFRLHVEVDSVRWNQPLVFNYQQVGAAEIYLDGQLTYTFGKVGRSLTTEAIDFAIETNLKIETLTFGNQAEHVIAVRYSNFYAASRDIRNAQIGFWMEIRGGNLKQNRAHNVSRIKESASHQFFFVGVPLAFTLLHLLLFFFYPRDKANLHYAVFTGVFSAFSFFSFQVVFESEIESALLFVGLYGVSLIFVGISGCRFLYSLFYAKLPKSFWLLTLVGLVLAGLSWRIPQKYLLLFMLIAVTEMLRVIVVAIYKKKESAWIIGIGGLIFIFAGGYKLIAALYFPNQVPEYVELYGVLGFLISMSVYLARSFAQANKSLEKQLAQVSALSEELRQLNEELEDRVKQRTRELENANAQLQQRTEELEIRNRFIRRTFGRYLSDEVVANLLESPGGLKVGGEKRKATVLMSDLRGFSAVAESLTPEQVVSLLNIYLGTMTDVIMKYEGTIDEFIGDAILVIFGAPIWRNDDAERAVACALDMQLAVEKVNDQNRLSGLPEVEMGIGINTGEVVVGNIGSEKRAKYGVVGRHVNIASRIESYTVGGQILISETTFRETSHLVRINQHIQVNPKGAKEPITIYEVVGIGGKYDLFLPEHLEELFSLDEELPLRFIVLDGKSADQEILMGRIVKLSANEADIFSDHAIPLLSNLKIQLTDTSGHEVPGDLYAKVVRSSPAGGSPFQVRFTSIHPEIKLFLQRRLNRITVLQR